MNILLCQSFVLRYKIPLNYAKRADEASKLKKNVYILNVNHLYFYLEKYIKCYKMKTHYFTGKLSYIYYGIVINIYFNISWVFIAR